MVIITAHTVVEKIDSRLIDNSRVNGNMTTTVTNISNTSLVGAIKDQKI